MPARKRAAPGKLKEPPTKRSALAEEAQLHDERRRSRRISSSAQKSTYFEEDADDDEGDADILSGKKSGTGKTERKVTGKTAKARRKSADKTEESQDEYEENGQSEDQEDNNGNDDKDEDDDDDEEDIKVKVVKIAPLRPEGGVPYSDNKVHKNTMLFLKDLKANNKRAWLKANDREFRRALKDWESFIVTLTGKLSEVDFTIPDLPPRDVIFRIYRDTRFSKDPTPYKVTLMDHQTDPAT
jgi:hypothetical protein